MQFLETIEGRSGEELTSAVLKFLLVNSATMRECFVERLRQHFPAFRTPTVRDGIICKNEVSVAGEFGGGRIDLLIREGSGVVLGVENKFWANFTDNQPKKYWGDLVKLQEYKDESSCRLVLLAPEVRRDEITKHIKAQGIEQKCCILSWEDVRKDLKKVACKDRSEIAAAAFFLDEYVGRQVLANEIHIRRHQLLGPRDQLQFPNDYHYEFLNRLATCLPSPQSIRPARNWIGFQFSVIPSTDTMKYPRQWFGFVIPPRSEHIVMGIDVGLDQSTLRTTLPSAPVATVSENKNAFVQVEYDESLRTTLEWKKRLEQILDPLADLIHSNGVSITERINDSGFSG